MEEMYENYKVAYRNEELEIRIKNAPKSVSRLLRISFDEVIKLQKNKKNSNY